MSIRATVNSNQLILGFGALVIGLVEYVVSRPADSTYLGKMIGALAGDFPFKMDIFGIFGGVVPEFVHPFSFALITMAIFPQATKKVRGMICLFWLFIELFFEVGQCCGHQIAQYIPEVFGQSSIVCSLKSYFINGTYDHLDVLAIFLGITVAYIAGEHTSKGGNDDDAFISSKRGCQKFETKPQALVLETGP
ncbi:MAG: hypothetical protein JRI58_11155 [Deltaproteobacteria bacterium]|nr:hypothetical protein [Deltaproteobacteria bacterium]MBW2075282.1 hypothetical protein [Deltaproteobacteria bacterium]RLB81271.1 MAG: hypothetical protein DRH17_09635 [Deltaproteobacteria bacterium]